MIFLVLRRLRMSHVQHVTDKSTTKTTYQGTKITHYHTFVAYLREHKDEFVEAVLDCLMNHVKLQHVDLLTDILTILATRGWNRTDFANTSLQNIVDHFAESLVKTGVDVIVIEKEWLEMVYYAKTCLNLIQEDS